MMEANDSSVDVAEESGSKRLKLEEKEDRISALPDPLIHHILSFLPSTIESIQTGILSKRWKNQWARVPVLIFNYCGKSLYDKREEDLARFIDGTLLQYECSKMKKFHLAYDFEKDTNFYLKLRFATIKDVEVLCLQFWQSDPDAQYQLPKFIFDIASLVELQIINCALPSCRINWPSLKALKMQWTEIVVTQSIENAVSGCPSLESLEIDEIYSDSYISINIASKSLKILILSNIGDGEHSVDHIEISCPNLEELSLNSVNMEDKTIVNVLSGSPLLHSMKLIHCYDLPQLVIVSKSLKKLVLDGVSRIEISCPNLEELILFYLEIENWKLMNLSSSCCATIDFMTPPPLVGCPKILARKFLKELQAVKEVTVGNWFVEILSALEMRQPSYPLLNIKCLTLNYPYVKHIVGIVNALRCSPTLERLVIKLNAYQEQNTTDLDLNNFKEAYLDSNVTGFTCFQSHLKTVKIIGLPNRDDKCKVVLHFLEFLLKNAKALEKMVVILKDGGTDFLVEVSRKLLSFPRVSQHAIVELL